MEAQELHLMSLHRLSLTVLICALFCAIGIFAAPPTLTIAILSSMPGFVSGGDALIEIKGAQKVQVLLNGRDVSPAFHADAARGSMVGLVDGLQLGANTIIAKAGSQNTKLTLTNHP